MPPETPSQRGDVETHGAVRGLDLLAAASYSGRIYAKSDHWFGAINLLFLLAIVVIPYPIRVWCFHLGTRFEQLASVTLVAGLAATAKPRFKSGEEPSAEEELKE